MYFNDNLYVQHVMAMATSQSDIYNCYDIIHYIVNTDLNYLNVCHTSHCLIIQCTQLVLVGEV